MSSDAGSENDGFVLVGAPDAGADPRAQRPAVIAALQQWLRPTAYLANCSDFNRHRITHVPGAGSCTLFMKAGAGAGKSVLSAHLIGRLQTALVCQTVTENHNPLALVRDWMRRLLSCSTSLQARLDAVGQEHRNVTGVTLQELWPILVDALLSTTARVYCVTDALDELNTSYTVDLLHLLLSPPHPGIQQVLNAPSVLSARLKGHRLNGDIAVFLEYRLHRAEFIAPSVREKSLQVIKDRMHPSFF
ncbi:hypothetical protein BO78DRAFT_422516 [Aspergillus sclerotiicarbonarius CBS 121057]|uniref:Nephrocystin 3-like N-terminal domain-containing protein n=1 Tax=Aspergillus sclerotiicarbonarius (strain CBS 121057 / IBT 28362) TaxID=1448318 RepID=A0A319DXE0_ASPSB|nr:hypothetical protein BO78DRAFT_422516 [Aspergillus sclerotiicarbonarius CBS 121057]